MSTATKVRRRVIKRTVHIGVVDVRTGDPAVYVANNPKALAEKVARMYMTPANIRDLIEKQRDPSLAELACTGAQEAVDLFRGLYSKYGNGLPALPRNYQESYNAWEPKERGATTADLIRRALRAGDAEDAVKAYFMARAVIDSTECEVYYTYEQIADFKR